MSEPTYINEELTNKNKYILSQTNYLGTNTSPDVYRLTWKNIC